MSDKKKRDAVAFALYGFWKSYHEMKIAKHQYKISKATNKYYERIEQSNQEGEQTRRGKVAQSNRDRHVS